MADPAALHVTDLLFGSMFYDSHPDRVVHKFLHSRTGNPFVGGIGMELYYDSRLINRAALYIRRRAARNLRSLPVSQVSGLLKGFVSDNFDLIAGDIWLKHATGPFSDLISPAARLAFATALETSAIFITPSDLTLFPLVAIRVADPFASAPFFLAAPRDLTPTLLPENWRMETLRAETFPPLSGRDMRYEYPEAWLGVWSADLASAKQTRAAILGAVALLPHRLERYSFSGRTVFGGYCTLKDTGNYTYAMGGSHTPPLYQDIIITAADHSWLTVLAEKLVSPAKEHKKQIRALEYYHRAWFPDAVRRFPTLFAALDAIYGDAGKATQAVVEAVAPVMGADYTYERLKLLLSLRASVIHGGAPNVYESSSYHKYFEKYETDAVADLELIVARCLQTVIFGAALQERPHTHAAAIKARSGRDI